MKKYIYLPIILLVSVLAGCTKDTAEPVTNFGECVSAGYPVMESNPRQCRTPSGQTFTEVLDTSAGQNSTEPVPIGVEKAVEYVQKQTNADDIVILESFEKEWPNSCLGLEQSGEACAQVITEGWQVKVYADKKEYLLRTNQDGSVVRQESVKDSEIVDVI